jgi:FkbM family methyltransferase
LELHANTAAHFTKWVVSEGLLKVPFVVIDVGVQGGESERWHALGDQLVLHGFDAIEEVADILTRQNLCHPNRHYHWLAVGKCDGEQTLYFNVHDPYSSSLYEQVESRFLGKPIAEPRQVQVRRLDTLLAQGVIPPADFLKVDAEGSEKDVFLGAGELSKGLLGFEAETSFGVSCVYPNTHFGTLLDIALTHHQRLFDVGFNRMPRASFQRVVRRENRAPIADQFTVGSPATVNVLFCRDLIEEVEVPSNYASHPPPLDIDGIIKQIIVYELYGLNDVAVDTVERLTDRIGARIDVEKAVRLLADPAGRTPGTVARLQEEYARFRAAHAESMADARGVHTAHVAAAEQRISELGASFKAHQTAYLARISELDASFKAHQEAYVARISAPDANFKAHEAAYVARISELDASFKAHQEAYIARICELEASFKSHEAAYVARISELEASFKAHEEAYVARIGAPDANFKAHEAAYVARISELDAGFKAHQEAYVARIMELERHIGWLLRPIRWLRRSIRPFIPSPIRRLLRQLLVSAKAID